jgi:ABC-type sulfate transport system permease component
MYDYSNWISNDFMVVATIAAKVQIVSLIMVGAVNSTNNHAGIVDKYRVAWLKP